MAILSLFRIIIWPCLYGLTFLQVSLSENIKCSLSCSCLDTFVDCSKQGLQEVPNDLPPWTEKLDLSTNLLVDSSTQLLSGLPHLQELKLKRNLFTEVPTLGNLHELMFLSLSHNGIRNIRNTSFNNMPKLTTLELNNNALSEIRFDSFSVNSSIQYLNLNNNEISNLEEGCFEKLEMLHELKLNRNQLSGSIKNFFKNLKNLKVLELNKNNFTAVQALSFEGLERLHSLKLRHNFISTLRDAAFWKLKNLTILQLDYNNISAVTKGWMYGLSVLKHLTLSNNYIAIIESDCWEFCQQLSELDLSNNKLHSIKAGMFDHLDQLQRLLLNNNFIDNIAEGTFDGLVSLEVLELKSNRIAWTIEDMNGFYSSLKNLKYFGLASTKIKTISKKAFIGLESLKELDLSNNDITTIQENSFMTVPQLSKLYLNTSKLLCDCNIKWFAIWLKEAVVDGFVNAVCSYPTWLVGRSLDQVDLNNFTCDDFPKPNIIENPETRVALKGDNISLFCKASSSSSIPMEFLWKKDNVDMNMKSENVKQFARSNNGRGTEQTSELTLSNVTQNDAGKYQCVVSNSYGATYSSKSKIAVLVYPTFTKIPGNITVRSGKTARLECAASGLPQPEIAWQKDGGNDFPAARERRMHVMPTDDVFFIINTKASDMGVYSCIAQNLAGSMIANASLNVLESPSFVKPMESKEITEGEPIVIECMAAGLPKPKLIWRKDGGNLIPTERHFFTAEDQLLVIVDTILSDAGVYECEMANSLGTEKGFSKLTVIPVSASGTNDGDITGIIIITVVCCAVGTSIVWVIIIHQTRKRMGLVDVGSDSCRYPNTILPTDPPHIFLDTNSEHSSGKDSGTGDSAKRSNDDFLLTTEIEGEVGESVDPSKCVLQKMGFEVLSSSDRQPQRTDHDRFYKTNETCNDCSQRWSAPFPEEMLSHSCSYHSLPVDLQIKSYQDNPNPAEEDSSTEDSPCFTNII